MKDYSPSNYRWVIVGVLWLVHVIGFFNFSSLGILAPLIKEDLQLSSVQLGLFVSAIFIGASLSQLPAGLVTDFIGVRLILPSGIAIMGVFLALCSFTSSYLNILLLLLIYGLANGVITPAATKSILDWFPPPYNRATAMAFKQTGVNFGGILAGFLLPILVIYLTWRNTLLMVGLVEASLALVIYKFLRESPAKIIEEKSSLPWKEMGKVFLNRDTWVLGGVAFFFMANQFSFSAYLTLFLTKELNYSIVQGGFFFSLAYFLGAGARLFWSFLSDYRLGGRRKGILLWIAFIMLFSNSALGLISFCPSLAPFLVLPVLAFGISGVGWNALFLTLLGEAASKGSTGLITGAGFFLGCLGPLLFPPFFGYLIDKTGGYGFSWLSLSLCAAGSIVLLRKYKERTREQ